MFRPAYLLGAAALGASPPSAQLIPTPLGNTSIAPPPTPTPIPSPAASPTPAPTPSPAASPAADTTGEGRPSPPDAPRVRPAADRPASVTPAPVASPTATPHPSPSPTIAPAPSPAAAPIAPPPPAKGEPWPLWPWLAAAGAIGLAALAWAALRLRRRSPVNVEEPVAPARRVPPQGARLALALRPTRAGLNLISATVEAEVTVANAGDAPADDIRLELRLMSAHAGQDAELAAFHAAPVARPATPPFALAPGEERRVRAVAALPLNAIHALEAGGRPMFVPLLALTATYRDADAARRVGQAYAVGVERVDSAKLAPFWLDVGPRQYDSIAARVHGAAVEA